MLVIDSRELATKDAVRYAFEEAGIEVRVEAMQYGDYKMELTTEAGVKKTILIERKTPSDFVNSTHPTSKDPATKLARQLNGCIETEPDAVVLLIDGPYFPVRGGRIKTTKMHIQQDYGVVASKLRTIQRNGIRVEHNMAEWYLPQFLLSMYKNETRDFHDTLTLSPKAFSIPAKDEAKWTVLMGIRGVGPKLAKVLLDHFGSIKAIANATPSELKEVKGVGQKLAESIIWYLN